MLNPKLDFCQSEKEGRKSDDEITVEPSIKERTNNLSAKDKRLGPVYMRKRRNNLGKYSIISLSPLFSIH